ncbi:hypothetical protein EYC08_09200 [Tabrizicola sp. WMC-M-20]|nr:hypothetical protein EYC08_09200 [Tabrizicola sp. WMC-M-20]
MAHSGIKMERICGTLVQWLTTLHGLFFLRRLALSVVIGAALLVTSGLAGDARAHGLHMGSTSQITQGDGATTPGANDAAQLVSKIDCGGTCCPTVGCAAVGLIPAQVFPAAIASDGVFATRPRPLVRPSPQAALMRPPQV